MDQQRKLNGLDKLIIKNGGLVLTALTILIPMYKTFVVMEHRLSELQKSVETLTASVTSLNQELQTAKTNNVVMTLRLNQLEQISHKPGLFKDEAYREP